MKKRILLVEDDRAIRTGLTDALLHEGHDVLAVADGEAAHQALVAGAFALVVLDLMLPKRSGLEVLRLLRERDDRTPVLVLTAKGDETDKVLGLELGADDYVTKPFSLRELLARVKAHLRRGEPRASGVLVIGDARVDLLAFTVQRAGKTHALSKKEAAILELLWNERNKAVSRDRFLKEIWGGGLSVGDRTIDTHVLNLRKKLGEDRLITVHGVGYKLLVPTSS